MKSSLDRISALKVGTCRRPRSRSSTAPANRHLSIRTGISARQQDGESIETLHYQWSRSPTSNQRRQIKRKLVRYGAQCTHEERCGSLDSWVSLSRLRLHSSLKLPPGRRPLRFQQQSCVRTQL